MLKPCRVFPLAIWTCLCPVWGENAQSAPFDRQETLHFKRGSMEWQGNSRERLEHFVRRGGPSGEWVIGVPRNLGASEQVALGRIRMIVGALLELGVVGVRTETLPAVPLGEFDPLILGVRGVSPWAGVDPNEDETSARPPVAQPQAPKAPAPVLMPPVLPPQVPKPSAPPEKKKEPVPAPKPKPMESIARWMHVGGGLAYRGFVLEKPPTAQLEARPYPVLSLFGDASTDVLMVAAEVAKTAYTLSSGKEQADPTNQLDVSRQSTNYFSRLALTANGLPARVPIQVSYADETIASTAVLAKNTLLFDRSGSAWVTLADGINYAYKTRAKTFALDWCGGSLEKGGPILSLGAYFSQQEKPFNVHEFGSVENRFIYTAKFHAAGIHIQVKGNPKHEGLHFGAVEVKLGRATGLSIDDIYQLVDLKTAKTAFNEFELRFDPHYRMNFGTGGFLKVTLPIEYAKDTFKTVKLLKANGDGSEAGLFGTRYGYGLKVDLGLRF